MDLSLVQTAVPGAIAAHTVEDEELAGADLILLDLATGLSPEAVVSIGPPVVAYGPHVDARALEAAVEAGCREALPRSQVFRRLPGLLG
ncbi:MAG TPA: hypothetical protein VLA91_05015 [Acidimicrobiia bacterium]|nr:hypothetical protein [Acidimicrobiia bacterium]